METFTEFGAMVNRPVKNLSPSKVDLYLKCPEQFRLRYIEKVPEKASYFLTSGTVVHAVIEYVLTAKRFGEKIPTLEELDGVFESRWKMFTQKEERKDSFIGWGIDPQDPPDQIKAECKALIPVFMGELFPSIEPALVEQDAKYDYPTKYGPVMSWGKLDLLTKDGAVWDWKTTRKISSSAKKSFEQFSQYSQFAIEKLPEKHECVPSNVTIQGVIPGPQVKLKKAFLVRGPKPKIEVVESVATEVDRAKWAASVAYTWEGITEGKFPPNNKHFLCKAAFCSFYVPCQGWTPEE